MEWVLHPAADQIISAKPESAPSSLYLNLRLERARQFLRQMRMRILDIAFASGFQSNAALSRAYRSVFGCSPLDE